MQNYGIAHVWAQGDFVTRGIAVTLLIMSVLSWSVIVVKSWNVMRLGRLTKNAEKAFWHSDDFADGMKKLGLFGLAIPTEYGGLGLSVTGYARAMQEVGGIDGSVAVTLGGHQSIGCKGLVLSLTERQEQSSRMSVICRGTL